jgi:hypothetical protein
VRSAAYAKSHTTRQKPGHFCGMPHSAPCRTISKRCRSTPHLCRSCCGRFRTKELGQATLLRKTIHLSAATLDSVWHLCSKFFFFIYGYHSTHYARTVYGNSVEIPWAKPERRKLRSAAPVQIGMPLGKWRERADSNDRYIRQWVFSTTRIVKASPLHRPPHLYCTTHICSNFNNSNT